MAEIKRTATQMVGSQINQIEDRINCIVQTIKAEEQRLRSKYRILQYQDALGLAIMFFSLIGMVSTAMLYYYEVLPAWATIVIVAIFASVSHELEHDLIHRQYFRKNKFMHSFMMLVVWIMRPNTVNPWYRRDIHFLHHKVSGTEQDLEERLVGNGIANRFIRFIVMADGLLGTLIRAGILRAEVKRFNLFEVLNAAFPFATLHFITWYVFLGYHGIFMWANILDLSLTAPLWLEQGMYLVNFMVVVLVGPNVLRSFCLNFITSYMHYYGGVSNLLQQTQILKPWFLWPMQLFCFNFGSTHAIHHFVVGQPFYIRQMVARTAHKVMKENGVRFNDLSTFFTANKYLPS